MKIQYVRSFVLPVAACVLAIAPSARGAEQLVDVVATGYGTTVREATKAALRSAVEQVVGTMVDATTLVENDKLIEDEILTYSAGMIASAKTVGEPKKSADGIFTIKVKASVKKGQLQEKLRAASTVNVTLDGADLFARMTAAKNNLADAEAMIKSVLAKHIDCVIAEPIPGENGESPIDLDPKTGEVFVNVRVRIDQAKYTQFANEVVEKIGPMTTRRIKINSKGRSSDRYKPDGNFAFSWNYKDYRFLVVTSYKTGSAIAFQVDKNILNTIVSGLDTGSLAVEVALHDAQGGEIASSHLALCKKRTDRQDREYLSIFALEKDYRGEHWGFIMPFYATDEQLVAQNIWAGVKGRSVGTFQILLGTFTPEELKSVGKLEIKVGHMKGDQFSE